MATAESTLELVASEVVAQVLAEVVADVIANDDLALPTSPSEALRIDVPLDDETSAEKVPPDAVALKIDPSVADGFAPNLGSPTGDPQLGGYPPDCGTKHYKYLSFAKCRRDRGLTHPMCYSSTLVDKMNHPVPVTYPVCGTDFGAHSFHKLPTDSMVLSKYGLGIALYFKFLKVMAWLFLVMFILSVPAMAIFVIGGSSNMDAVTLKIQKNPISVLGMTSMGNLGQQTTTCGHAKVGDALTLTCDYGEIGSLVASYSSYDDQGTCACPSRYAPNDQGACQASPVDVSGVATCLASGHGCYAGNYPSVNSPCCAFEKNADGSANFSALQVQTVAGCSGPSAQSIVQGLCLGQTSCTINVTESSDYLWKADSSWNTTCPPGGNSSVFCSAGLLAGGDFSTCPSPSTRGLLVVAQCFTTQIDISNSWAFRIMGWDAITRPLFLKMAVGLDVIACAVFLLMVVWMKRQEANAMARIEHERTTVQNYTVQLLHLPKHTDVLKLGVDLATHLETVLTAKEPVYNPIPVKVADVHFGMTNAVQIDVMRKRGTVAAQLFLENQRIAKFKALQEKLKPHIFEKRLGKLLKASRALDEKLQKHDKWLDEWEAAQKGKGLVAVTAYITFEDEEGYLRCLREYPSLGVLHRLFQPYHKRFMKKRMRIEPAPDPTDIIWENLDYSWAARMLRVVCVNIVALALLLLSFLIIYLAKTKKNELTAKFATPLACPVNVTQWDVIQEQTASSSPAMAMVMCYCKAALLATASLPATMDLEFYNPTTQTSAKYCKTWGSEYLTIQALMVGSVVVVVLVNALLTPVLQYLVRLQKSHTLSAVIVSTVRKIFLAQFFNTTLIVLFLNANLSGISTTSDTGFHFVGLSLLNGKYADFSVDWYNDVGVALLLTMLINAISPQIGVFVTYLLRQVAQWRDRSFTFDFTRTRQETQRDLEALYRGPEFDLATRYSQIINTIFITLLFSSGMPLMLLIGLFSIIITYWTDKFTFLRVVRSPPQYDGRIATVVGSMLPYAILLHMLFGIWMYSNTNIFQSPATELTLQGYNLNAVLDKGGKVVTRATAMPAAVLFAAAVAGVAVVVVRLVVFHYLGGALRSVFPMCTRMLKETKPPRHLPNYFDALPLHVLSDGLGSASLKPSLKAAYAAAISRRSTEAKASLQLSGCHSYDILHNPSYKEAFGGGAFARQLLK
ncbi:hypothetical protein SDRG_09917 [Saprolegnia diclina VS20]|uniref:CSC1/OSCA1-like 7TM region domain-containing protein n=1 Tax=Saprolegnia diclina (strain VS20) TaxID=1156394 RepID=T0RK07_SAPDV|nr:hypothetical protein SDRG_09917 [Saprolegnia diclina VS20]EQC32603.1 hypothetical protein SDRG_09917 [Saprolegnia diclina VS20]|eukprot:XP_008614104.1 hypothetical protein SDRG_09917 [Saprolegnia diclina VS20]